MKRHLKLANKFSGGFIKFDKTSGKIAKVSKKTEIIAKAYVIFQFVVIIVKIWSITAKTGNLIEKILGIAITSLSTTVFLLRYHTTSAQVQVQFLNYIFFSEGFLKIHIHRSYSRQRIISYLNSFSKRAKIKNK